MRFLSIILLVTAFGFSVQASKLEKQMKIIDRNFKAISKQLGNENKKEDSLKRIDTILEATKVAQDETPTTISKMPTDQQADATTKYKDYLQKLSDKTIELKVAIDSNNVDQSKSVLKDIDQLKKDGHKDFKKKKK